jgi:nucleotide-binding universal stress UspA family protein
VIFEHGLQSQRIRLNTNKDEGPVLKKEKESHQRSRDRKCSTVLVAVDFSECSKAALRKAKSWSKGQVRKILALHVIDQSFIKACVHKDLGSEKHIKEKLFLHAKEKLGEFLRREDMNEKDTQMIVCEGIPCIEINKQAIQWDVDMIIMGSKGNSDDMKAIFFGSTTERVLRFIKRPVLCVPPEWNYRIR